MIMTYRKTNPKHVNNIPLPLYVVTENGHKYFTNDAI